MFLSWFHLYYFSVLCGWIQNLLLLCLFVIISLVVCLFHFLFVAVVLVGILASPVESILIVFHFLFWFIQEIVVLSGLDWVLILIDVGLYRCLSRYYFRLLMLSLGLVCVFGCSSWISWCLVDAPMLALLCLVLLWSYCLRCSCFTECIVTIRSYFDYFLLKSLDSFVVRLGVAIGYCSLEFEIFR